jgi:hypothetical protein
MARAMRREEPEGATPSELERLGDELGRRGMCVTLAPAPFWRAAWRFRFWRSAAQGAARVDRRRTAVHRKPGWRV